VGRYLTVDPLSNEEGINENVLRTLVWEMAQAKADVQA